LIVLSGLAILALFAPWIVASTPLRDILIRAALANPDLAASSRSASFGWTSPVRVDGLHVARKDGQLQIDMERLATEKPWLRIWRELPDIGQITISRPTAAVVAGLPRVSEAKPVSPSSNPPTLSVMIRDAALTVVVPPQEQPVVDMDGLNLALHITRREGGGERRLVLDPAKLFDHRQLTPEMCDRGLQLFAPVLADAARVEGEVSLQVDRFELPLDLPPGAPLLEQADLSGQLHLHQVTTGVKNPLIKEITELVARVLRVQVPQQVRIADDAVVRFALVDGRIFHEGLAFGLPEVSSDLVIRTSGTVGLDETLDLAVEIPLPLNLLTDGPIARRLSERPLTLNVTGTLTEPKVGLPQGEGVLKELAGRLLNDPSSSGQEEELASSILNVVGEMIEERRNENGELETPILDRLRQRRLDRAEERANDSASEGAPPPRRPGLLRRRTREP